MYHSEETVNFGHLQMSITSCITTNTRNSASTGKQRLCTCLRTSNVCLCAVCSSSSSSSSIKLLLTHRPAPEAAPGEPSPDPRAVVRMWWTRSAGAASSWPSTERHREREGTGKREGGEAGERERGEGEKTADRPAEFRERQRGAARTAQQQQQYGVVVVLEVVGSATAACTS